MSFRVSRHWGYGGLGVVLPCGLSVKSIAVRHVNLGLTFGVIKDMLFRCVLSVKRIAGLHIKLGTGVIKDLVLLLIYIVRSH